MNENAGSTTMRRPREKARAQSHGSPETIAAAVLKPDERLLWAGCPEADVMIRARRRRRLLQRATILAVGGLLVASGVPARLVGAGLWDILSWELVLQPHVLAPAAAIVLVIPALSYLGARRFERYARSLTYAMTDHRLLVFEHGKIVDDFPPERLSRITVRPRGRAHGDVVFGRHYRAGSEAAKRGRGDPVIRERNMVAFKALPNSEEMRARIEGWLQDHRQRAVREVEAAAAAFDGEGGADHAPGSGALRTLPPDSELRRLTHPRLGLSVAFPAAWQVHVRRKEKPQGHTFLDAEDWQPPEEASDWNVVRGVGRMHCSVEAEIFATAPTLSFKGTIGGRLAAAMAGKVIHSDPQIEINGVPGFSVTRRREVAADPATGRAVIAASTVQARHVVLHDGRRQVCLVSTWPEDVPELERIVDAVVRSVRLE